MTFSATEAAFEGFRVVRRHPLAIVFWALAYTVFFAAFFGLFAGPLATVMATTESLEGTQPSAQEMQALMASWSGFMVLALPLSLVLGAVLNAAVARSVLRPADKAFGYMRLGADELRVLAVSLILGILFFAATVLLFVVVGLLAGVASQANTGVGILVGVLLGLGAATVLIWLAIRLSLAVPTTFDEKRISPFASFGLTKGRVLPLLGMAVIAFIMSMLVGILAAIVALPVTMATGGLEQLVAFDGQSTAQILQTAGVGLLAWGAINAIFSSLQLAVIYAPFSAAYRDLKGLPQE
ncbi:hypothetical protein [Brevundimonas sp.]|uniref:hypothetical protein n=1 Tax=Brevundimonas sp. TaxID=1871086 RepID=UPI00286CF7C2|nr:hypothetical protein [Brevundimonas sp.]